MIQVDISALGRKVLSRYGTWPWHCSLQTRRDRVQHSRPLPKLPMSHASAPSPFPAAARDALSSTPMIPRMAWTTAAEFLQQVVEQRQPVIITGVVSQWPAYSRWTPEYFQRRHGDLLCRVVVDMPTGGVSYDREAKNHIREMRLADFVDFMRDSPLPCYYRRQHAQKMPGIEADCDFSLLTPDDPSETNFVWIGTAGTRTGLHFDMQDNVLCQLFGTKELWLVSPRESHLVYSYPGSVTKSRVAPDRPDLDRFPAFAKATVLRGTLAPGEALFIPYGWWHGVISTTTSISVSHEFGRKITWADTARAVNAGGVGHWLTVARDFLWYGLLNQPFRRRLGDDPPFGRLVYEIVRTTVAARWLGPSRSSAG